MGTTSFQSVHPGRVTAEQGVEANVFGFTHSLSVVLPAYNEAYTITRTITSVLGELAAWNINFEMIVVNDGSTDGTGELVLALAQSFPQVLLITHEVNRGYGAALNSGFSAATKELTFFMDSDGQFTIRDLWQFFPFIDEYDAVLGYRLNRQDTWMRKLNAWGWKWIVTLMLGVHVRDIDCAFKLLHTTFLHAFPLETSSALINAELLFKLTHTGGTYQEIGVHHLPRQGGKATGAKLQVILRALQDLFISTRRWKHDPRFKRQMMPSQ